MIYIYKRVEGKEELVLSFPFNPLESLMAFIFNFYNEAEYKVTKDSILLKGYDYIL